MVRFAAQRAIAFLAVLVLLALADAHLIAGAWAQNSRAIQLAPGRAQIVPLPVDAGAVIVGNPAHLTALLDSPRKMILIPQQPGLTSLTVLDRQGETMLNSDVIVSSKQPGSLNVVRSCTDEAKGCKPLTTFHCNGPCVEITPSEAGKAPEPSTTQSLATDVKPPEKRQ